MVDQLRMRFVEIHRFKSLLIRDINTAKDGNFKLISPFTKLYNWEDKGISQSATKCYVYIFNMPKSS